MIIQSVNKGIYERIVRNRAGQLVRVRFAVTDVNGELKGHIISAEPVLALETGRAVGARKTPRCDMRNTARSTQLCLPASVVTKIAEDLLQSYPQPTSSPYHSILEFFMSQPTRAPSRS